MADVKVTVGGVMYGYYDTDLNMVLSASVWEEYDRHEAESYSEVGMIYRPSHRILVKRQEDAWVDQWGNFYQAEEV